MAAKGQTYRYQCSDIGLLSCSNSEVLNVNSRVNNSSFLPEANSPSNMTMTERHGNRVFNNTKHPCDRYIPFRAGVDINQAYHDIFSPLKEVSSCRLNSNGMPYTPIPQHDPYTEMLAKVCGVTPTSKILSFTPKKCSENFRRGSFSSECPKLRFRKNKLLWSLQSVLDLPNMRDDFYTNNLDWSAENVIAVALGSLVAFWNFATSDGFNINVDFGHPATFVSSLAWDPKGQQLVIGSSKGEIVLIDYENLKKTSSFASVEKKRIGVVEWSGNYFFSGSSKGVICMHDPRAPMETYAKLKHHSYDICGLQASPDMRFVACGGDHGNLLIWEVRERKLYQEIEAHKSGNRALAWVPWKQSVIATGGGAEDGHVRLWNINDKSLLFEHDTKSQVSAALWSAEHMALLTSHGVPAADGNDILAWKWHTTPPIVEHVATLKGHQARPLHMALSPDGNTVASAGADETLRLWKLSGPIKKDKGVDISSPLQLTIR